MANSCEFIVLNFKKASFCSWTLSERHGDEPNDFVEQTGFFLFDFSESKENLLVIFIL